MIAGLSKAVTLYLAPLLLLTALLLSLFALLAPTLLLDGQVALLTVTPSNALIGSSSKAVDGPSLFLGMLGSCSRVKSGASINCTSANVSPQYDVSALPAMAPSFLLSAPAAATPVFVGLALLCSTFFLITFTLISFRHSLGTKIGTMLDKPLIQNISACIGFIGFIFGLSSFLIVRIWFGKAVQDFNANVSAQGRQGPALIASTGNAFTMVWVAYAFFSVPIIISLSKLNVKATK